MGSFIEKIGKLGELIYGTPNVQGAHRHLEPTADSLSYWIKAERDNLIDDRKNALGAQFDKYKIVISEITIIPLNNEALKTVDIFLEMDEADSLADICEILESPAEYPNIVQCENLALSFGEFRDTPFSENGKSYEIKITLKSKRLATNEKVSARTTSSRVVSSSKASNSQIPVMKLTIQDNSGVPQTVQVYSLPFTIGRNPGNDLQLKIEHVTGDSHLEISKSASGKFQITDKSTNGTFWTDGTDIGKGNPVDIASGQTVILALGRELPEEAFKSNLYSKNTGEFPLITFEFGTPGPKPLPAGGTPKPKPLNS